MSGNPFRRSTHQPASTSTIRDPPHIPNAHQHFEALDEETPQSLTTKATTTKKVRITSPPRSPPHPSSPPISNPLVRRLSGGNHAGSPPPSIRTPSPETVDGTQDDPFSRGSDGGDSTEDEVLIRNTRRNSGSIVPTLKTTAVPSNPFSRTLATLEPSSGETPQHREAAASLEQGIADQSGPGAGRGSMDVDSFKRLLMTGTASPSASAYSTAVPSVSVHHRTQSGLGADSSSSTDTSSISRQSIFEPVQEAQPESPRTSYELSITDDDENSSLMGDGRKPEKRKKPPPPTGKRRHGKLVQQRAPQTVSFSDFSPSIIPPAAQPLSPVDPNKPLPPIQRTSSDLNKPLPPPPESVSLDIRPTLPEEDIAQPFDPTIIAPSSATEDTPSPQRKKPPTPPLARRPSQRKSLEPGHSPNHSSLTRPQPEEDATPEAPSSVPAPSTQPHKPPPPPPTRRTGASTTPKSAALSITDTPSPSTQHSALTSPPPAPPSRNPSNASTSATRPRAQHTDPTKTAPPAPPPPRRGSSKSSIDFPRPLPSSSPIESRRASAEVARSNSIDGGGGVGRRVSGASVSSLRREVEQEGVMEARKASGGSDILAEMDAMQREVEALRERYRRAS